ncbi:uncharacterized protein LOC128164481 [Crassostrea angulata]|uniref:uncharacterized protein LOC128164481 n=1 Tax=Magallana angulata TaxID=2784310 RepID=UPI0022B0CFD5|nr:uncharacterized protein LOC128164481 [Crassostrea angulata]
MKTSQFLSGSMVVAVVAAEVISWGWQWYLTRTFYTGVLANCALACVLKYTKETLWWARGLKDSALLSLYVTTLYVGLQAPHEVSGGVLSTVFFLISVSQKFLVSLVIVVVLDKVRF